MIKAIALIVLPLCVQMVKAHPHAWVNVTTDFIVNATGRLSQVKQRWIFDPLYSALTLDDLKKEYADINAGLNERAKEIINNLESLHYYSHLEINKQDVALQKPTKWHLSSLDVGDDSILILEMHFAVMETNMANSTLDFSVYDPTYYVSMRHDSLKQIRINNESALECQPEIFEPTPSSDLLMLASSLDKTQSSPNELGKYFAQTVEVTCF